MWVLQLAVTLKHVMDCMEEQEGLDSRAQQSRLSSKVFLGAFSVLRCENDELSYTALRPTSIQFNRDSKTATCDASAKRIWEIPLWQPCRPDNNAIFAKDCQRTRGGSATERNDLYRRSSVHGRQQPAKPTMPKRQGLRCPQAYPAKCPCFRMTLRSLPLCAISRSDYSG